MLWNLLDGRAYTATELAVSANLSLQSASNHLKKLTTANILTVEKQGRHRYFKFASNEIAQVIESMASLIPIAPEYKKIKPPKFNDFTYARTCYDHIAGTISIKITKALIQNSIIKTSGKHYEVTKHGHQWFYKLGIDSNALALKKRSFAHKCLDWSERKHHMAGALGAEFLERIIEKDWVRKQPNSRTLTLTSLGKIELKKKLNLDL